MKIKKTTKKVNKPILIIAIILLVGLAVFLVYTLVFGLHKNTTNPPQSQSNPSNNQPSETPQTTTTDKQTPPNTDAPATPTTVNGSTKKQVTMVASEDQSNGYVYIRGGINYPVTGGSCYAQLTGPSGQSIKKDSDAVLPSPASADCKTISIPTSDLAPGAWTFTLNYTSDGYEGVSSEVSFTI